VTASTEMRLPDSCEAVSEILARVGDKWSVLIVMLLGDGPRRFNELKRLIGGISQRMLTLTLRGLERDGLVTRTMFPHNPAACRLRAHAVGTLLMGAGQSAGGVGARSSARDRAGAAGVRPRQGGGLSRHPHGRGVPTISLVPLGART
jgi:DNA-binding HxlR family transcriptional regulator